LIADVAGKGIPAALYTGSVKHILRMEQKIAAIQLIFLLRQTKL
jgi:serine phosphatase RsbU (regulator of sigma subunit)